MITYIYSPTYRFYFYQTKPRQSCSYKATLITTAKYCIIKLKQTDVATNPQKTLYISMHTHTQAAHTNWCSANQAEVFQTITGKLRWNEIFSVALFDFFAICRQFWWLLWHFQLFFGLFFWAKKFHYNSLGRNKKRRTRVGNEKIAAQCGPK